MQTASHCWLSKAFRQQASDSAHVTDHVLTDCANLIFRELNLIRHTEPHVKVVWKGGLELPNHLAVADSSSMDKCVTARLGNDDRIDSRSRSTLTPKYPNAFAMLPMS